MDKTAKNDLTIILPCFNESSVIADVVRMYHKMGFMNILVIDDGSWDMTSEQALSAKSMVIRNNAPNGFLLTALRGVYKVQTKCALIINPDSIPAQQDLDEFLDFAISGNYGLLFSRGETAYSRNVTRYLKKKFGIFLSDPSFEVVFLNEKLLEATKNGLSLSERYLYPNLIARAVDLKIKVGTYNLRLPVHKEASLMKRVYYPAIRNESKYEDFFEYAFPDLRKQALKDNYKLSLLSAIIGALLTILTQLVLKRFNLI